MERGRMGQWLNVMARLPSEHATFARRASIVLLIVQAAFCIAAASTLVMLHGDGAFFVYAIGTGHPWMVKWGALETRSAIYLLSVVPTQFLAETFQLTGREIAALNGFLFSAIPVAQLAVVLGLAWRRHPGLLIFPVAQYAFATGMGFGFPSEIMLAPGFFWICMFLLLRRPVPVVAFVLSYAGLVFCHELAIPAALVIGGFAWAQGRTYHKSLQRGVWIILACCASLVLAWLTVRLLGGGAGADWNAKYVFDPRRVFNNPTLWIIALTGLTIVCWSWRTQAKADAQTLLLVAGASLLGTMVLGHWLNFASGRYDSARTLIGLAMVTLGSGFSLTSLRRSSASDGPSNTVLISAMPIALTAALAINVGASAAFLFDWCKARQSFEQLSAHDLSTSAFKYITFDRARDLLTPRQVQANERMGFEWSWPFRSLILAEDYRPGFVIYSPPDISGVCHLLRATPRTGGSIPADAIQNLEAFSCAQPLPPAHIGLYERFMIWLRALFAFW
jgi:hypothetical protein